MWNLRLLTRNVDIVVAAQWQVFILGSKLPFSPCVRDGHQPNSRQTYEGPLLKDIKGGMTIPHYSNV